MTDHPRLRAVQVTTEGTWVRHALVDIAGDLAAGAVLSQIAYWFGWDRKNRMRVTIQRDGHWWLAKSAGEWHDECRVTENQARRALKELEDRGLIETHVWMFRGARTTHIRLCEQAVEDALASLPGFRDFHESPTERSAENHGTLPHTTKTTPEDTKDDARPEVERLCVLLCELVENNGSKRPEITKRWRDACRLMLDRDGRTEQQIETIIRWSQADEFWRGNILSMPTLREKFDRLRLARNRSLGRSDASSGTALSTVRDMAERLGGGRATG